MTCLLNPTTNRRLHSNFDLFDPSQPIPGPRCHHGNATLRKGICNGIASEIFLIFSCNGWPWNRRNALTSTDLNPAIKSILLWVFEIGRNVLEFSTETNVALTEGKATKLQPCCQPLRSPSGKVLVPWNMRSQVCCNGISCSSLSWDWVHWVHWMLATAGHCWPREKVPKSSPAFEW